MWVQPMKDFANCRDSLITLPLKDQIVVSLST